MAITINEKSEIIVIREDQDFRFRNKEGNRISPKHIVALFILMAVLLPFSESGRVLLWNQQADQNHFNPFNLMVNVYAVHSEKIKNEFNIEGFFQQEALLWLNVKNFPIVKSPIITFNNDHDEKIIPELDPEIIHVENQIVDEENNITAQQEGKDFSVISPPYNFLLIGDSFMGVYSGVGDILEKALLGYEAVSVNRFGKVSSGLSRPDFFDWNQKIQELTELYDPNIVIIMMGNNDAQSLTVVDENDTRKYFIFGKDGWEEEYGKRVNDFLKIMEEKEIVVFWVGLPIMREKNFSDKMKLINSIYEAECNKFKNSHFISTWFLLADEEGNYAAFLQDEKGLNRATRASDGIHVTFFSGRIITKNILEQIESKIPLELIVNSEE